MQQGWVGQLIKERQSKWWNKSNFKGYQDQKYVSSVGYTIKHVILEITSKQDH